MLDKDKLILIFYINVDAVSKDDVHYFITEVSKNVLGLIDNSIKAFFFPIRGQETHVECLNPHFLIDEKIYNEYLEKLEQINDKFDNLLKNNGQTD